MCYQKEWWLKGLSSEAWRGLLRGCGDGGADGRATNDPVATSGNEVIAVDWKGLKDVDQIHMDSTSSLHGSSLHRPSTEVRTHAQQPPNQRTFTLFYF